MSPAVASKGWVRAAKGQDIDPRTLNYKTGDAYLHAAHGRTNQQVMVKCGLRWVRLGKEPGPVWLSAGKTVDVACQSVTRVSIEPGP